MPNEPTFVCADCGEAYDPGLLDNGLCRDCERAWLVREEPSEREESDS